jgi:uncharacterized membrane protein YqjE
MGVTWGVKLFTHIHGKLYDIMLYRVYLACAGFELTTLLVMVIDCIDSHYKSNYHTITTTMTRTMYFYR